MILLKLKNLIYICVGAILIMACIGIIYSSLDNMSNIVENSSKVNDTSNNSSDINCTENNTNNFTNQIGTVKDNKNSSTIGKNNESSNIPKKSKLSYSEAFDIAKNASKDSHASYSKIKSYIKYEGYDFNSGELYWEFKLYSEKDNKLLDTFRIQDSTGYWQ